MRYCVKCLYPDTKPDLRFEENGKCSACVAFERRHNIDWKQREKEFQNICSSLTGIENKHSGRQRGTPYHCIVPVSGGKDSHYQTLKALEYGLNPLAVCATTDDWSTIGRHNLNNISSLGVDLLEITVNTKLRRRINAYTLREVGDISWAEHITIFTIPYRVAYQFDIPLILWGENPQNEYGGPDTKTQNAILLDRRWLSEFGGLLGLRVSDIKDALKASEKDIHLYTYPDSDKSVKGLFLGQFFQWDGAKNAELAASHGFKFWHGPVEGTGYMYENLDNLQTGVHDYLKYIKYGFGRCTDMVNNHIRRGNLLRNDAKQIVLAYDGAYPMTYLGVALEDILDPLDITIDEFLEICNKFANKDLFECKKGKIPKPLFRKYLRDA